MQRVIGRASVRWAWTVKEKTGSLGTADREMRGVEVVKEMVRCEPLLPDCGSAWANAIVIPYFDQLWTIIECLIE